MEVEQVGQSAQERELSAAYKDTTFVVDGDEGPVPIRISEEGSQLQRLLETHGAKTWAFITAWNPASEVLSPVENAARHQNLLAAVQEAGLKSLGGRGVPADSSWQPEESLMVFDISEEHALSLGRMFGQLALISGGYGERARLVWCRPRIPESVVSNLCRLGRLGESESAEAQVLLKRLAPWGVMNREAPKTWDIVADGLDTNDLANLVRGLVVSDEALWPGGGSTSGMIWTHMALQRRDPEAASRVAEWARDKTTNCYSRFGYRRVSSSSSRSDTQPTVRTVVRQEAKSHRLAQAKAHVATASTKAKKRAERAGFLVAIADRPLTERLEAVLRDRDRALLWFPDTWAMEAVVEIAALSPSLRDELIERLRGHRKGPWRQLRDALTAARQAC